MAEWETVVGLEVHAHLKTRTKMFCRCALEYGARREHAHVPGLPRASGRAAGAERAGDRVHDQARPRARLRDRRAARSSRARTTSIPTCRRATRSASTRRRSAGRAARRPDRRRRGGRRHRARAPRGGRGEDRARGRRDRPLGRRRLLARRLQPRRHAAARDRHRARPPLRRRGDALPAPAAPDDRRARHLRRGDGEGHAARGRQRLGAQARGGGLPAALGDQEHELVHVHRPRDRGGRPPAGRGARGGRDDRAVDVRLRRRHRPADRAPLEGGGGRLPLLPRARPRPGRAAGRARRAAAAASCRSCRLRGSAGSSRSSASSWPPSSSRPGTTRKAELLAAARRRLARRRERGDEPRRLPAGERARARARSLAART